MYKSWIKSEYERLFGPSHLEYKIGNKIPWNALGGRGMATITGIDTTTVRNEFCYILKIVWEDGRPPTHITHNAAFPL